MARTRRNTSPALEAFHPAVKRWFTSRFETVTPPQAKGWPAIREGRDTLIAAPTGSGKTLSAFLNTIDALVRQGVDAPLPDQTQVLYVSPLKALSNDIRKNLSEPLAGIREALEAMGVEPPEIRVLVRTGDTKASERAAMVKRPPHILVTTPESLYILLTSAGGRKMLETVRTVIVDEIHAVARDRRGAHLALSLERLDALVTANAPSRPVRIGLSATQRPIEEMARFLIGAGHTTPDGAPDCAIVDEGHARTLDLGLELPSEPMSAVMSNETWEEVYDRLAALVRENRTTLIFTNTRRLAERLSMHLTKRLGEGLVTSHHGSLSREQRLDAEERLKAGSLRALVATASLELGIDIGDIDLVCQIGSTRAIATLLQRVGRSGHTLGGTSKGRLFPTTRDDLMECIALLLAARRGKLDRLTVPEKPLDVLAQQIVAAAAIEEWDETDVFDLARRAYPYRGLTREEFDDVVKMLAEGFSTRMGRGGGRIHYDGVNRRIRARKGSRLAAVTSGGAIPENADYRVLLQPQGVMVGTVNEDFAIESMPGDIFQLGISAWRILKVSQGKVLVEDAHGQPPTIPFWLGEAPARTAELSEEVSALRAEIDRRLGAQPPPDLERVKDTAAWLAAEAGIDDSAAEQTVEYLAASKTALGVIPTQRSIVLERFFDESGGMQLVLHAPFGGRVNRAWGLALRKKFCRAFNQELQAAATEDNIVLSLGPQHSFPLNDVFHYLSSKSAREVLTQALLAAPMFEVRWRWNATRSLAVLRHERGKKVPPPIQRMRAGDLLAAVFPSQVACAENVAGDIEIPDHPLVRQTVDDCLHEAMDVDAFLDILDRIENGELQPTAVDTVEPSPMAHEILSAKPYAFLDDAPLEERRAQAVMMRRTIDIESARDLGALDASAIALVREQAWPDPRDADELHDALALLGYATEAEAGPWAPLLAALTGERRAAKVTPADGTDTPPLWIAAERLPLFEAVFPSLAGDAGRVEPPIEAPERERAHVLERSEAMTELVRGRMESLGPVTARGLAASIGLDVREIDAALAALEADGAVLRGAFTPRPANGATAHGEEEWCDRRLLARIHRYTLDRLRKEIEPVSPQQYMRFLFAWQHAAPETRLQGASGLAKVLETLQGYQAPAGAWEGQVLSARMDRYAPSWLDELSLTGQVVWGRLFPPAGGDRRAAGPTRSSPVALLFRDSLDAWLAAAPQPNGSVQIGSLAQEILDYLKWRGPSFAQDLGKATRRLNSEVRTALGQLVNAGLITGDGFGGLRGLISPRAGSNRRARRTPWTGPGQPVVPPDMSGRWALFRDEHAAPDSDGAPGPLDIAELWGRQLLQRYGVVFHKVAQRETGLPPWRDLLRVWRRMEARGEIRGGRFVSEFSGEQYALPEAVDALRAVRRKDGDGALIPLSGADPLNLTGIITPGERVPSVAGNRVVYQDGLPVATRVAGAVTHLREPTDPADRDAIIRALRG